MVYNFLSDNSTYKMKKRNAFIFLLTLLISIMSIAIVSAFSVEAGNVSAVCAGSTIIVTDIVSGSGAFTVISSGTAKSFSTTVPSGFSIDNGVQYVYSYITPTSRTSPGNYDLILNINSGSEQKQVTHTITVGDCHESDLTIAPQTLETCPCSPVVYTATLRNRGQYLESFQLSVEGPIKNTVTLSDSVLNLNSGENKTFTVYVNTSCNSGKYDFTIKARATTSSAINEVKATLDVRPCYEYSLEVPQNYYSICEHSSLQIPLTIRNEGTANNKILLNFKGPSWSALNKNEAELKIGFNDIVNISANPDFRETGNFTLYIEAMSTLGYVKKTAEIKITVEKCYDVFLNIVNEKDKICNGIPTKYEFSVKNTGKFNNTYNLGIKGPDWISIDKSSISLDSGEEKSIALSANPSTTSKAGAYEIAVNAIDPISMVESKDVLEITSITVEDCYKAAITTDKDVISVAPDSAATVLLNLENQGVNNNSYIIDISGAASSFVQVNPGIITLQPGKAETVYLYISPPLNTEESLYEITISARLKDTTILSSKKLGINVTKLAVKEAQIPMGNETISAPSSKNILLDIGNWFSDIFRSIGGFFSSLFTIKVPETANQTNESLEVGNIIINESIVGNVTEISEASNQTAEGNETIIANETETLTNETTGNETTVANETLTNETSTNETITNQTNQTLGNETIVANETLTNETAGSEETLNQTTNITAENIGTLVITENESQQSNESQESQENPSFDIKQFLIENRIYIIGIIVILLIIVLFSTGLWKRIINFFEDEVEEKNSK